MASNPIAKFVTLITPPPVVTPDHYDGWQLRWKAIVFRPALLKTEAYLAAGILFYLLFAKHLPLYEQQFSRPQYKGGLTGDGYSDFFGFSTGRRNVVSLHTIFTLRPRHDFFQWLFQTGKTLVDLHYRPADDIQLDFKLAPGALADNFVFAIVAKDELLSVKENRWDLTFTKTTENPALPPTLLVMSEYADVTENVLKQHDKFSLAQVLRDPKILSFFRSLSITDQPRDRPELPIPVEEREKHVILSITPPSNPEDSAPLVAAVFQLIDLLNKISLRPETKSKLRRYREDIDKEIKEEAEKEKKEEALEAKATAKRKAMEERLSKLSAADQKKELEKERKRTLRKTQGKVVRK
ncbi:hypothetical protein NLJ89_g7149 [Agrocybe chaxingu]|uniref:DUF1682-domain-containing protein n=1 Tax=Agrocybe chaxingu TaxID=84603 RepID=A0A9W8JXW1_9AGAR|nr:hypothetical protein NLJ89_g7149 [Agrocybe chaxingu]